MLSRHRPIVAVLALFVSAPLFAADGDADASFSSDGQTTYTISPPAAVSEGASCVAPLGDGSLLVGGYTWDAFAEGGFAVVKYGAGGGPVTTWGSLGNQIVELGGDDSLRQLFVEPDGKILLAGWSYFDPGDKPTLARLTAGGVLDEDFATAGKAVIDPPWGSVQIDGFETAERRSASRRVFFYGRCTNCPTILATRPFVLAVTPDGEADPAFQEDGWAVLPTVADAVAFDLDAAGRPLVAVREGSAPVSIWRLTHAGEPDPAWGDGDGHVETLPLAGDRMQLLADPSGERLYLYSDTVLWALLPSGAVDEEFGDTGSVTLDALAGGVSEVRRFALQSDGKLVGVGRIEIGGAQDEFFLVRLGTDGLPDTTFSGDGFRDVPFDLVDDGIDIAQALTLSGGKLVAVGQAEGEDGEHWALLRTESALVFTDGFERGSTGAWSNPLAEPGTP